MRLVKCRKCGTTVMTDDTLLENMIETMNEANAKAIKAKNGADKQTYRNQASQLSKMITQVMHRTSALELRRITVAEELAEITRYIIGNNLVSYEKLDELREIARERAKKRNAEDEAVIAEIYGDYESNFFNKANVDNTPNRRWQHGRID